MPLRPKINVDLIFDCTDKWPTTSAGFPSTSGTTASICFIMNNKYYTGHVGDSKIVLGKRNPETKMWIAHPLTKDHKPDSPEEKKRIAAAGGEVMNKAGIERVVWYRPKSVLKGPIRRSVNFDKIPFLAVARSLGDLWSYNPDLDTYVVSPDPDVEVIPIDQERDMCLVFASDGLWNMLLDHESIRLVQEIQEPDEVDKHFLTSIYSQSSVSRKLNPAQALVDFALQKWYTQGLRADNTSVVTLTFEKRNPESIPSSPSGFVDSVTVLDFCMRPFEYLISSDESQTGPREHMFDSFNSAFGKIVRGSQDLDREDSTGFGSESNLSPPLQSLCSFTKNQFPPSIDQQVPLAPLPLESWKLKSSEMNVNKSFDDTSLSSNSLKSSTQPKVHKVISGFEVFRDYNDDDDSRSSGENDEARAINGKSCRDESCSVTEELVDRLSRTHHHHHPSSRYDERPMKASALCIPPRQLPSPADGSNVLKEVVAKNGNSSSELLVNKKRRFSTDGNDGTITGVSFKRRRCSSDLSPPAKHLRSSRWSRGVSMHLPSRSACKRKWNKVAASILTKSRLRARKSSNRL